jgi:hypothetical protein
MAIPIQYGSGRMAGNIIYMSDIAESVSRSKHRQDGVRYYEMVKTYTSTFAIAFCEGPVPGIARIWMNSKVIADWRDPLGPYYPTGDMSLAAVNLETTIARSAAFFTVYLGSETQMPDPAIVALLTEPETPAYRGLVYIVFKDFPIGEFSGVPNIEVEVCQSNEIASIEKEYASGASADNGWVWALDGSLRTDWIMVGRDAFGLNKGYMRFLSVDLANGAILTGADIYFSPTGSSSYPVDIDIHVELSDNAAQISSGANFVTRSWSTEKVNWTIPSNPGAGPTPNISSLVELITSRPGWAAGNAIQFLLVPTVTSTLDKFLAILDYPNSPWPILRARYGPY